MWTWVGLVGLLWLQGLKWVLFCGYAGHWSLPVGCFYCTGMIISILGVNQDGSSASFICARAVGLWAVGHHLTCLLPVLQSQGRSRVVCRWRCGWLQVLQRSVGRCALRWYALSVVIFPRHWYLWLQNWLLYWRSAVRWSSHWVFAVKGLWMQVLWSAASVNSLLREPFLAWWALL